MLRLDVELEGQHLEALGGKVVAYDPEQMDCLDLEDQWNLQLLESVLL
jgi:hypothetical protein